MKQRTEIRAQSWLISSLLLIGICASCLVTTPAQAADKKEGTRIGVLNEAKLSDGYTKYQEAMKKIDTRAQQLDEQLKARDLLTVEEGAKFDALIVKTDRTKEEQAELDALLKAGNERRAELLALSGKATRTDAENARIKELQDTLKANSDAVQKLQDTLLKSLLDDKRNAEKEFTKLANDTVAEVAKEHKLDIVLSKTAVVWSLPAVDITDDVIKKLSKSK